jgi:subtilisin family serine protease
MQRLKHNLRIALLVLIALWPATLPGAEACEQSPQSVAENIARRNFAIFQTPSQTEFLIKFRTDQPAVQASFLSAHGLTAVGHIPWIDVWVVTQPAGQSLQGQDLAQSDVVAWVEPNGVVRALGRIPDDYWFNTQKEYLMLMRLPDAWDITTGDARLIAVVDTGVDLSHPDLRDKIWTNPGEIPDNGIDDDHNGYIDDARGWNFVRNNNQPEDDYGHGSQVAGIAAASTDNKIGMAGVSWPASIMPLKALDNRGEGTFADVASAIIYAADNGARIINLSLGGSVSSTTILDAVTFAQSHGSLLIAAAGNAGAAGVEYPAALPGVMAAASTTSQDTRSLFSNYGPEMTVAAPGENILSTSYGDRYVLGLMGTSMSAAHVSGLAALVWSVRPEWDASQVAHIITETAHDIASPGWDVYTGWGRIDAYRAALAARPKWFLPIILKP